LLSYDARKEIEDITCIQTVKLEPILVKGKSQPIEVYEVVGAQLQSNKRRYSRAEVRWPCTLRTADTPIKAEIENISSGGAFVSCRNRLELNKTLQMIIKVQTMRTHLGDLVPDSLKSLRKIVCSFSR
jgi:hypothetical protein